MRYVKKRRILYLLNFLAVLAGHLWILHTYNWNVMIYTCYYNPWWLVMILWIHMAWGLHNLVDFINNRIEIKEIPEDKEEKDEE